MRKLSLIAIALLALVIGAVGADMKPAHAQQRAANQSVCRAVIIIDRSSAVGYQGLERVRNQIVRLFQPGGIYNDKIELAFWSFSNIEGIDTGTGVGSNWPGGQPSVLNAEVNPDSAYNQANFNAPYHGYVSSKGESTSFGIMQKTMVAAGFTNYEQGFGYQGDKRNPALGNIIDNTDVMVFLAANKADRPSGAVGNSALDRGFSAAEKHRRDGRAVIGGYVGDKVREDVNQVINGDKNNSNNTFHVKENYSDLAKQLKQNINEQCAEVLPGDNCIYNPSIRQEDPDCKPDKDPDYNLRPITNANSRVLTGSDSATVEFRVNNEQKIYSSKPTDWKITRLAVSKGQSVSKLSFGSSSYRDELNCEKLLSLVSDKGSCDEVAKGRMTFAPGSQVLTDSQTKSAGHIVVNDRWDVGTRLCFFLSLRNPTNENISKNRYSQASCVVIGKRPFAQVRGGDLIVRQGAENDPLSNEQEVRPGVIKGSTTVKGGKINKTFGGWSEYGVFSPGLISGFSSQAGLEGGFSSTAPNTQFFWSRLSFANGQNYYGGFNEAGLGYAPDVAQSLLNGRDVVADLSDKDRVKFTGKRNQSGVYLKPKGDILLDGANLKRGEMVIVHAPEGTVEITKDITYENRTYNSPGDIPQMVIIARDIVIDSNVAKVESWLIAETDDQDQGGRLFTCDYLDNLTADLCNEPLTVNGPVIANELFMLRTAGAGTGQSSSQPAEVFNLRADAYLWAMGLDRSSVRAETTSQVELPPRF